MTTSTIRCALYLRVSLDATGEMLAVERQREDCRSIAAARGWTVVGEYVDNSVSASDARKKRPGYDALVTAYGAGRFDALICYDLDRLTRQPRQLEDWIDAAERRGLLLVTANGEADLTTDGGRMFARVKLAVARSEVERKSARQQRAAQQRAQKGRPPLGVRLTGYTAAGEVVESEAKTVRFIFDRFAAGDTIKGITSALNSSQTRTRRGGRWAPTTIRGALRNPRYAGRAIYQGKVITAEAGWEPIVDAETWAVVQARLCDPARLTNRRGVDRSHLGSGLYVCSSCGSTMGAWSPERYRCRNGCHGRSGGPVDGYVLDVLAARLRRPDIRDLLRSGTVDTRPLDREAARLQRRLRAIDADYDAGNIDGVRYKAATDRVRVELAAIDDRRASASAGRAVAEVLRAADPGDELLASPLAVQRAILDALCTVTVGPGAHGRKTFDPESVQIAWKAVGEAPA